MYKCDPKKNTECEKTYCKYNSANGECEGTSKAEYSVLDDKGEPIIIFDYELKEK